MHPHPLRLSPGDDLRACLDALPGERGLRAAFVIQGIGSLRVAQLRFAGVAQPATLRGDLEIVTLAGSLSPDGAHLHMAVADAQGRVFGGHVSPGCIVRTTAEILVMALPEHVFARERDARTGYPELTIHAAAPGTNGGPRAR